MQSFPPPPYGYSPPPTPPPAPEGELPEPAKAAIGCGSLCGMAVLAQAVLIWGAVRLAFAPHGPRSPGGYVRVLETPAVVGKPFAAELILKNTGVSTMHVISVKAPVGEKASLGLAEPDPAPKQITRVKDEETWRYDRSLAPRQEFRIHFKATPTKPGKVSADLAVDSATPKDFHLEVKANPK